jgi:alanyl aminopeptidase
VIGMFEHWIGRAAFDAGLSAHLQAHRHGTAGAPELLAALSTAARRDVSTPFRTFLDQPGLPNVEARLACDGRPRLVLEQSRFLPIGSKGSDAGLWQIPVCAKFPDGKGVSEACTLLSAKKGELPLAQHDARGCPAWFMPNADGAGYYRFSMPAADAKRLAAALPKLTERDKMSFAESIKGELARGRLGTGEAFQALAPLAADESVAATPMREFARVIDWLHGDPAEGAARAWAARLYAPLMTKLGWVPKVPANPHESGDSIEQAQLRPEVVRFLALVARDPGVRREAAARGRAWVSGRADAAIAELLPIAAAVALEEGDEALFEQTLAKLERETREREREIILQALGSARRPDLAARARGLALRADMRLPPLEMLTPLRAQTDQPELRDAAWAWLQQHVDEVLARLPETWRSYLVWVPVNACDRRRAEELQKLFEPRLATIPGGARELAGAVEHMTLCAARRAVQEPSARPFFAGGRR